jgi:hypothetical protein
LQEGHLIPAVCGTRDLILGSAAFGTVTFRHYLFPISGKSIPNGIRTRVAALKELAVIPQ